MADLTVSATIAVIAGFVGGLLSGLLLSFIRNFLGSIAPQVKDGSIRAQSVTLVDDAGRQRAVLRLLSGDATLLLADEAMSRRVRLSAGDRGPFLHFVEGEVNSRLGIGILQDGSPGLELADADGTPRASLSLNPSGITSLALRDNKGTVCGRFEVSAAGDPSFLLSDSNGKPVAKLP